MNDDRKLIVHPLFGNGRLSRQRLAFADQLCSRKTEHPARLHTLASTLDEHLLAIIFRMLITEEWSCVKDILSLGATCKRFRCADNEHNAYHLLPPTSVSLNILYITANR
jgi:hypothetical protein